MKKRLIFYMLICCICFSFGAGAVNQHLNLPQDCVTGELRNGLKYIILPNNQPAHNIEFRLVMNVGSILEEESEKGVAHFIEHMAFAGTKNFPGRSMIDHFESIGMKFGRDINAYTGYDRTVYWLTLPVDKENTKEINTALLTMRDWLCDIDFIPSRIEQEKGVILEELRGFDFGDTFYNLKVGNGKYAKRMALGERDDINNANKRKLKSFFKKHYCPSLATVIVVGNVDVESVEAEIIEKFSSVKRKKHKDYCSNYPVEYWDDVKMVSITDTIQPKSKLDLYVPYKAIFTTDIPNTIKEQRENLLVRCLDYRCSEVLKNMPEQDFEIHNTGAMWYLADKGHFATSMTGKTEKSFFNAIELFASICSGIAENGITHQEMEYYIDFINAHLNVMDRKRPSINWCDDFIDYAIFNEKNIYDEKSLELVKEGLANTTSEDIQEMMRYFMDCAEQSILVGLTSHKEDFGLTESDVRKAWNEGISKPYIDSLNIFSNIKVKEESEEKKIVIPEKFRKTYTFQPTDILRTTKYPQMGVTELNLRNGLRIIMKPTVGEDKVYLSMIGRGGTAHLSDEDYNVYKDAIAYMDLGGIDDIPSDSLTNITVDNDIFISFGQDYYSHKIMASSKEKDVATMLQVMLHKIYHPGLPYEDFEEVRQEELESVGKETILDKMLVRDVNRVVSMRLDKLLGDYPANIKEQTADDLKRMELDSIANYFSNLFGNPNNTTLIFTGNFEADKLTRVAVPILSRMRTNQQLDFREIETYLPFGRIEEKYELDRDDLAVLQCVYPGNYQPSLRNSLTMKLLRDILQARMLTLLREKYNIVYSPYVDLYYDGLPQSKYNFRFTLSLKDENIDLAKSLIANSLADLKNNKIDEEELNNYKRSFIVTKRKSLTDQEPIAWKNALENLITNGESLDDFENYEDCLGAISVDDIVEAFNEYFNNENLIIMYQTPN